MYRKITVLFLLLLSISVQGQEEDLFRSIKAETQIDESLLPDRMVFTQSLLWGERGLMRKTGWSPLTIEQREKELKIRRKMLKLHQLIGYVTLAGMVTQGILGTKLLSLIHI